MKGLQSISFNTLSALILLNVQIYIDESGIITNGQGNYFLVTAVVFFDDTAASRCLKTIRNNHLKKQYKKLSEIKLSNSSPEITRRVLQCITKHPIQIYYYAYKKTNETGNQFELKIEIFSDLLNLIPETKSDSANVIIDKFLKKSQQVEFTDKVRTNTNAQHIQFLDSAATPGLQIADFICGTIARYYNHPQFEDNLYYYSLIKEKIIKYR